MTKVVLVLCPEKRSPLLGPIASLLSDADHAFIGRVGGVRGYSGLKGTRITIPADTSSMFAGGTLRPLVALEDLLDELRPCTVWVAGDPLHLVAQTAHDANGLGYPTRVRWDTMAHMPSTIEALRRAGVYVVGP